MYKIRNRLLWLLVLSPVLLVGQIRKTSLSSTQNQLTSAFLTNEVQTNRQTVFIVHLLTDQVDPEKNYEYELLIKGQKVSLPYPTQFQTRSL